MNSKGLIKLFLHPFFMGFLISAIIAVSFIPDIQKYRLEVIEKQNISPSTFTKYVNLDKDEIFERVKIHDTPSRINIIIDNAQAFVEQYNLESKPIHPDFLNIDDSNQDGFAELFLLTTRNDSLFLSIIDPLIEKDFIVKERLIYYNDTISFEDQYPQSRFVGLLAYAKQSQRDVVFAFQAGFKKQPRTFFRYNIKNDELSISPLSGASYGNIFFKDLDSDSIPELLMNTIAVGNHEAGFPYTDQSAWLMVLDQNLEFTFDPVEFPEYPTSLVVAPFENKDSTFIAALHLYNGTDSISSSLNLFDARGRKVLSRPIGRVNLNGYILSNTHWRGQPVITLLDITNNKVTYLNEKLEAIRSFSIPELRYAWMEDEVDLDFDGKKEKIFHGRNVGSFVIFRENLGHALTADLGDGEVLRHLSPFTMDDVPCVYAEFQTRAYVLRYRSNPLYYLKYPLALLVYLAVSMAIYLVFRLQKYRAERDYQAKRKMNELQILSLKNQIEPHFTFNILNSIGSLYTRNENPKLAYDIFVKYSNLLRFTIKNSDRVGIPLEEELDFVNTYVELEQFRSGQAFEYQVDIADGADLAIKVPRMLIHTFVENAIKHGIRRAGENALLELKISRDENSHQVLIRDNGTGLHSESKTRAPGTGKGLQIVDEMLDLFYQLEGIRINYSVEDLSLKDPKLQGTEVKIRVLQ